MPDVSYVGRSGATSNSANTLSVNLPTGTVAGDVVVIVANRNAVSSGDSIVDNNGSTPFTRQWHGHESDNGSTLAVFHRLIQSGDPSSFSFTFSGDTGVTRLSLRAFTFRDVHADIYDVAPSNSTYVTEGADGGDIGCVNITSTVAGCIHIIVGSREGGVYDNDPSGYTLLWSGAWDNQPATVHRKTLTSAGATGTQTYTGSGSGSGISQSFIIKNNAGGGGGGGLSPKLSGKLAGLLGGKLA